MHPTATEGVMIMLSTPSPPSTPAPNRRADTLRDGDIYVLNVSVISAPTNVQGEPLFTPL